MEGRNWKSGRLKRIEVDAHVFRELGRQACTLAGSNQTEIDGAGDQTHAGGEHMEELVYGGV